MIISGWFHGAAYCKNFNFDVSCFRFKDGNILMVKAKGSQLKSPAPKKTTTLLQRAFLPLMNRGQYSFLSSSAYIFNNIFPHQRL